MTTSTPGELWAGLSAGEQEALRNPNKPMSPFVWDRLYGSFLIGITRETGETWRTPLGEAVLAAGTPQATPPAPTGEAEVWPSFIIFSHYADDTMDLGPFESIEEAQLVISRLPHPEHFEVQEVTADEPPAPTGERVTTITAREFVEGG